MLIQKKLQVETFVAASVLLEYYLEIPAFLERICRLVRQGIDGLPEGWREETIGTMEYISPNAAQDRIVERYQGAWWKEGNTEELNVTEACKLHIQQVSNTI